MRIGPTRYAKVPPGVERVEPGASVDMPAGDGSHGLLEAFSSSIRFDGSQPVRWYYAVRGHRLSFCATGIEAVDGLPLGKPQEVDHDTDEL